MRVTYDFFVRLWLLAPYIEYVYEASRELHDARHPTPHCSVIGCNSV